MADIRDEIMLINGAAKGLDVRSTICSAITKIRDDVGAFKSAFDVEADAFIATLSDLGGGGHPSTYYSDILNSMKVVGSSAFYMNSLIKSIAISAAYNIEDGAFYGCTNLVAASFPRVNQIGVYAFSMCSSLVSVYFPNNGGLALNIGAAAFEGCRNLVSAVFGNVGGVYNRAFKDCVNIASVDLGSNVASIRSSCFAGCYALESVEAPNVTKIEASAFAGCVNLSAASFSYVTEVGEGAFLSCGALSVIDMPALSKIGNHAFDGCSRVSTLTLDRLTSVPELAFNKCYNLQSVSLQDCSLMDSTAFANVHSIATAYIAWPPTSSNNYAGDLRWFTSRFSSSLKELGICMPEISENLAFNGIRGFSRITVSKVSQITAARPFCSCSGSIINLYDCTSLRPYTFYDCRIATALNLYSVTELGQSVIYGCTIGRLGLYASQVVTLSTDFNKAVLTAIHIDVPQSLYSAYLSAPYWSDIASRIQYGHQHS